MITWKSEFSMKETKTAELRGLQALDPVSLVSQDELMMRS